MAIINQRYSVYSFKDKKTYAYDKAVLLAVIIAVFCPNFTGIGSPANLSALILVASMFVWNRRSEILYLFYGLFVLLIMAIVGTIVGLVAISSPWYFNIQSFGPFIRILICFFAVRGIVDPEVLYLPLLWVGFLSAVIAIAQFFIPAISEITSAYYMSTEREMVFHMNYFSNTLIRVIGFFENPSSVALVCIIMIMLTIQMHSKKMFTTTKTLVFVVVNLLAGLLSLSKIFVLGLPLVFVQLLVMGSRNVFFALVGIFFICFNALQGVDSPIKDLLVYTINSSIDSDIALKGRYLNDQIGLVMQSILFGYGFIHNKDVVVNDSAYLIILYRIGLMGAVLFSIYIVKWVICEKSNNKFVFYNMILVILLAGIGTNSILGYRIDVLLTVLCVSLYLEPKYKREYVLKR